MKLAFASPPQTVSVGACSSSLIVESRDALDQMRAVTSDTTLTFSSMPFGTSFFTDASCNSPALITTLTGGSSRVTLYFRANSAGTPTITVMGGALASAMQTQTIVAPPDALVLTVSGGNQILAGSCLAASVTAESNTNPINVPSDTNIGLTVAPLGFARFYGDAACTNAVTSVTISRGTSSKDFYVKPITGGNSTVTAAASFGSDTHALRVTGAVHRGQCTMGALATSVNCNIPNPALTDLNHSLLVFQATTQNYNEVLAAEVRCRLAQTDSITCTRAQSQGSVTITWQVLELVSGMSVQRLNGGTCPLNLPLITTPVDATRSVLLSHVTGQGTNYDGDDMTTTRLTDAGVAFDWNPQPCTGYDLQIAEFASPVAVQRGSSAGFASGSRLVNVVGLSPASVSTSVLLASTNAVGGSAPNSASMCHFFTRGELDTSTSLRFTRGSTSPNGCDNFSTGNIVWQRVDFGTRARVQPQVVTIPIALDTTTVSFTAVDTTRTLIFPGGAMASGLATGETAWDNGGNDEISDVIANFELLSSTQVRLSRADVFSAAQFTLYVVEFEP